MARAREMLRFRARLFVRQAASQRARCWAAGCLLRAQDDQLRAMVKQHGGRNWKKIAESLSNKTDVQCLHRWQKVRC